MQLNPWYGFTIGCQAVNRPINLNCIKYATDIGMGTMRYQERAALVNPAPNQDDFSRLDAVVTAAMQANLEIVYTLQLPADFGLSSTPCDTTDGFKQPNPGYMAGFAKVVALRYNGLSTPGNVPGGKLRIGAIEIGNEPDVHYVKPINGVAQPQTCRVPELWIPIWQACIPAIRSVSDAEIGMGALWWENRTHLLSYLEAMYQTPGLMQAFAYLNFHWYGGGSDPMLDRSNGMEPSFPSEVAIFQQVMAKYNDASRGLKCTEFGWQTSTIGTQGVGLTVDQPTQQKYLQSALDVAQKAGMSGMYYFTLNEENGHSLVLKDPASGQLVYTSAYHYLKERIAAEQVVTTPAPAPIPPPVVLPPVPAPVPPVPPQGGTMLPNFPMVSQLTTVTGDGRPSENAQMDCVAASIDALCRYLLGTPENSVFNPDHFKDAAYGEAYRSGTSASAYEAFCKSIGIHLYSVDTPGPIQAVQEAHNLLSTGKAVIFTELDPYVDTALPQYAGWTHVCVWYAADAHGLTALDPYIGKPVYKTDATWTSLLRSNQLWTAELENTTVSIDLSNPSVAAYFKQGNGDAWACPKTGKSVALGMLAFYRSYGNSALCGLTYLGLPVSNEIAISGLPGCTKQFFERGVLVYDPAHHIDAPPGAGSVYLAHLYNNGPGQDPLIAELEAQITTLQQSGNPALLAQYTKAKERIDQASAVLTAP